MARYTLTSGMDRVVATGARNVIYAPSGTLSAGDVIVAAPGGTALVLEKGNRFDLAAPATLSGVTVVADRSVGDSVITLRDGLDLTLRLGIDTPTVYGAANTDRIIGGKGFATVFLGGGGESFVAGGGGACVHLTPADAGARIEGGGNTTLVLTGTAGTTMAFGTETQGVAELDVASAGLRVSLIGAGVATVALSASDIALRLDTSTSRVSDYAGGNTIAMTAADQTLVLPYASLVPDLPADHLIDFVAGDAIDVDIPDTPHDKLVYGASNGELTLIDTASGAEATIYLTPGARSFTLAPDHGLPNGDTGTLITLEAPPPGDGGNSPPCFATGTRVLTDQGWRAVELLAVGDRLITLRGEARRLRWIGHRRIDCARHPDPASMWPVCVAAGAFGEDLPQRDVLLSPDHALFVGGVLIPVKLLVNGANIRQLVMGSVRYFHLELASHDVVLAEGLPVETYLDTGNRHHFDNGGAILALHARFGRDSDAGACAPLVFDGPILAAARRLLLERADAAGYRVSQNPDLQVLADGQRIWGRVAQGVWSGWVPARPRCILLRSRAQAPCDCSIDSDDRRKLGIALNGITLAGHAASLRVGPDMAGWGDGFYPPERDAWSCWRWSDGAGTLLAELWDGISGPFRLDLHLFRTGTYRVEDDATNIEEVRNFFF